MHATTDDHHFNREDRTTLWRRIAGQIRARPDILSIPLANIERWLSRGRVHPVPLLEWQKRILSAQAGQSGMVELLQFMEAPNHESEPLKSCSPFVGLPKVAP